jgi:hypothetical protein
VQLARSVGLVPLDLAPPVNRVRPVHHHLMAEVLAVQNPLVARADRDVNHKDTSPSIKPPPGGFLRPNFSV